MSDHFRLRLSLLLCRLSVAVVFLAWTYDKLKVGFGLPGIGVSDRINVDYYNMDLPSIFFAIVGVIHISVILTLLLGVFRRVGRAYVLILSIIPFLLPKYWSGLYEAVFVVAHPTILFFSATAFVACAYMIFALRDYDTLLTLTPGKEPDFSNPAFRRTLGRGLLFCRLAVFIIFMVWIYSKIVWPEKGVTRMRTFWLIPNFPSWGVVTFAWVQLIICFAFLLGIGKRLSTAFFVFLGFMAVFTPRALKGKLRVFTDDSWHTILLYPGFCLLVCTLVLYLLRDFDTRFQLTKK